MCTNQPTTLAFLLIINKIYFFVFLFALNKVCTTINNVRLIIEQIIEHIVEQFIKQCSLKFYCLPILLNANLFEIVSLESLMLRVKKDRKKIGNWIKLAHGSSPFEPFPGTRNNLCFGSFFLNGSPI